jgi:glycosyltransferase involved in cell wall biosynthesis
VLLPGYRRTLVNKYSAQNVLLGTHGTFSSEPEPPDFSKRGNPQQRILAIGHWGTYKRLETLMAAFPLVLKEVPEAKLVVAGANHHTRAGYWESIRDAQPPELPIEFKGYVAEEAIPDLFQSTSILVLPYDSATGSSGPAHQACEFGVPIVCADLDDFRGMVTDEDMAVKFYRVGDHEDLARQLIHILKSQELQRSMAEQNLAAGVHMTMSNVIGNYLRWFKLQQAKKKMLNGMSPMGSHIPWTQSMRSDGRSPHWGLQETFPEESENGSPVLIVDENEKVAPENETVEEYETAKTRASKRV